MLGKPLLIQLPFTGDEDSTFRREEIAKPLAVENEMGSIILQLPFYGKRRISSQENYTLPKAEYMAKQTLAAVMETVAITKWLTDALHYKGKIGITGISFGGAMSALSSLHITIPHAVISHVPSNCPADAYVHGGMSWSVNWKSFPQRKASLDALFQRLDIGNMVAVVRNEGVNRPAGSPKHQVAHTQPKRIYVQITALHDVYVPYRYATKLYQEMSQLPNMHYSHFHPLLGGHGSSIFLNTNVYRQYIRDAMQRLE